MFQNLTPLPEVFRDPEGETLDLHSYHHPCITPLLRRACPDSSGGWGRSNNEEIEYIIISF